MITPDQFWIGLGILLALIMILGLSNRKPRRKSRRPPRRRYNRRPPTSRRQPRNWRGNYPEDRDY